MTESHNPPPPPPPAPPSGPPAAPPPPQPGFDAPGAYRQQALEKVRPPAIALLAVAGVGAVWAVLNIVLSFLNIAMGAGMAGLEDLAETEDLAVLEALMSGSIGVVTSFIGIAVAGFMIYAALKMQRLESWGLCLAGSIAAMVPCISPCCCLGLPIGIWAIVVLLDEGVKAAFTRA